MKRRILLTIVIAMKLAGVTLSCSVPPPLLVSEPEATGLPLKA